MIFSAVIHYTKILYNKPGAQGCCFPELTKQFYTKKNLYQNETDNLGSTENL